jgi:hypothetical protein
MTRGWQRLFDGPIPLPSGRHLLTLKDAAQYILKLPKSAQQSAEWQAAGEAVIMAAEDRPASAQMRSIPPKVFETSWRQLGISHGVLNVLVAEVGLKRPRVVALRRQGKTAGVPQHVRMHFESEVSLRARALKHAGKAGRGEG